MRQVLQANPMIPTLKAIVAKQHDDPAWLRLRPPLVALARRQSDQLWNDLTTTGFAVGGADREAKRARRRGSLTTGRGPPASPGPEHGT